MSQSTSEARQQRALARKYRGMLERLARCSSRFCDALYFGDLDEDTAKSPEARTFLRALHAAEKLLEGPPPATAHASKEAAAELARVCALPGDPTFDPSLRRES